MKILFLSQGKLSRRLGGPKVVIELGDALRRIGCETTVLGPDEVVKALGVKEDVCAREIPLLYNQFLKVNGERYDVIDYDHAFLPFPRTEYSSSTLMVARSVLLLLHLSHLKIPQSPKWKHRLGRVMQPWKYDWAELRMCAQAEKTIQESDLINVSNRSDVELLVSEYGVAKDKIVEIPFGISEAQGLDLNACSPPADSALNLVMVGTFDFRKGCLDIPRIFHAIKKKIPEATLTLLGCRGLYRDEVTILESFASEDREGVQIVLEYAPKELSGLLNNKTFGVFPSYLEGFGIGVVEMLAAGIPVVAYDVPGPDSILKKADLVESGDIEGMIQRILTWWDEGAETKRKRREMAMGSARSFRWELIAEETKRSYEEHRSRLP